MSSNAGGEMGYLREKSPRVLYNAAQRSWYDQQTQIAEPQVFLRACVATELADVLSDQMLQLLGEEELYPLAVAFCNELARETIQEALHDARQEMDPIDDKPKSKFRRAATKLVKQQLNAVEAVVTDYYCSVDDLFADFDEETAAELREARYEECKRRLEDVQILREKFAARAREVNLSRTSWRSGEDGLVVTKSDGKSISFSAADERHRRSEDSVHAR